MQRVWTQLARPQTSCNCFSCTASVRGSLARRTASATSRRRLNAFDAFTILLPPVLTTAFVADLTSKDKRGREWDRKIAEVQQDVERLRISEQRIVESLRIGTKRRRGLGDQLRTYSTTRSFLEEDGVRESRPLHWPKSLRQEDEHHPLMAVRETEPEPGFFSLVDQTQEQELRANDAASRLEKLVALKLVIKMRLHLLIGKSPRYARQDPGYTPDYEFEEENLATDANGLVQNLKHIRKGLQKLSEVHKEPETPDSYISRLASQRDVDDEIKHHVFTFQQKRMSVSQLVTEIGNAIVKSPEPPSIRAYILLLKGFSREGFDDLATLVIATVDEAELKIPNECLVPIIMHYGKSFDGNSFGRFLRNLTNHQKSKNYLVKWSWKIVNDVQIPCPDHDTPRLLQALAYTALKCNQPQLAEGWAILLREAGGRVEDFSYLIWSFLRYYAIQCNWRRGQAWLTTALDWATRLAANHGRDLRRVIFAMLELSLACGKQEIYTAILQAAASTNLLPRTSEQRGRKTDRSWSLLFECEALRASQDKVPEGHVAVAEDADTFQKALRDQSAQLGVFGTRYETVLPTPQSTKFAIEHDTQDTYAEDEPEGSSSGLQELCREQEGEIRSLRMQLAANIAGQLQTSKPKHLHVEQGSESVAESHQVSVAGDRRRSDGSQNKAAVQAEVNDMALAPKAKAEDMRQLSVSTDVGNMQSARDNLPSTIVDSGATATSYPTSCKNDSDARIAQCQLRDMDLPEPSLPVVGRSTQPHQPRGSLWQWAAMSGANLRSSNMGTNTQEAPGVRAFSQTQTRSAKPRFVKSHTSSSGAGSQVERAVTVRKTHYPALRIRKQDTGKGRPPFFHLQVGAA